MDIKQFITVTVGLIVGIMLITGAVVPAISGLSNEDAGEVIEDFSKTFPEGVQSEYNSSQVYIKGVTPDPPKKVWTAEDFSGLEVTSTPEDLSVDVFYAYNDPSYAYWRVYYSNTSWNSGSLVVLDEPEILCSGMGSEGG